jgi:hypothetical protein
VAQLNVGNRRASKGVTEQYEGLWRPLLKPTPSAIDRAFHECSLGNYPLRCIEVQARFIFDEPDLAWPCFLIAVVRCGSFLTAHLDIRRRRIFLAPIHDRLTDGFTTAGHTDRASPALLVPAASFATLLGV